MINIYILLINYFYHSLTIIYKLAAMVLMMLMPLHVQTMKELINYWGRGLYRIPYLSLEQVN